MSKELDAVVMSKLASFHPHPPTVTLNQGHGISAKRNVDISKLIKQLPWDTIGLFNYIFHSSSVVLNPGPQGTPVLHVLDVSLLQHT